jgi:hypothetical protein
MPKTLFLFALLVVWASQIVYLWPAPPFVAKESIELLGGIDALWMFYFKWLGIVAFGFLSILALYKRHRYWPVAVFLSSALYLWAVHFPSYLAIFFTGLESLQQLPRRFQLLLAGLSNVTLLHIQLVSPLFFLFAAGYSTVWFFLRRSRILTHRV